MTCDQSSDEIFVHSVKNQTKLNIIKIFMLFVNFDLMACQPSPKLTSKIQRLHIPSWHTLYRQSIALSCF